MSIIQQGKTGLQWTSLSAIFGIVLQLIQIAILARFLEAEAFGLMALAVVAINFAQAFSDIGLSSAIIHHDKIHRQQLSTLYWLNILAAGTIACIVICSAPIIADFYNQPDLANILITISACFICHALGQQPKTLLQKELQFKIIAVIEMVGKIIALSVAVCMAYYGFGVYALVYAAILSSLFLAIGYMVLGYKKNKPGFYFDIKSVSALLHFGTYTAAERIVTLLSYNIDSILIGKLLGIDALGLYNLAKQIIIRPAQIINPIVTKVTVPIMAKMQNDITLLRGIYLKTTNYLASVNFPIYGFIGIFAATIVNVVFGSEWTELTPIIQILCIYGALRSTANPLGSLIVAKGRYKLGFYWNMISLILVFPAVYTGSYYGLIGVCWALVMLSAGLIIPHWFFIVRTLCAAGIFEYHKQILIPCLITIIAMATMVMCHHLTNGTDLALIFSLVCGCLVLLCLNMSINRDFIRSIITLIIIRPR